MMLALTFASPWLLVGLAAAAIPFVLHLLASVRAPQEYFPTLRFLKSGMEKTARRRRLEHWLLMLLRSVLLGVLALAVSEPILRTAAGFWADKRFAAVIIIDNSCSMGARRAAMSEAEGPIPRESRFDHARREAAKLLGGRSKPSAAALLLTNSPSQEEELRSDLEQIRRRLSSARPAPGRAAIAEHVREALSLMEGCTAQQKAVYVFSDLQRISFQHLGEIPELKSSGVALMVMDCSGGAPVNVGIEEVKISGSRIVGRDVRFTASLVNSSPTDKVVHAWLQIDGRAAGEPVRTVLQRSGRDGARATVHFRRPFTAPGVHVGQVGLREADDLAMDNTRRFCLEIGRTVRAVLVGGGRIGGAHDSAGMLSAALESAESWSIQLRTVRAGEFDEKSPAGADVIFFADVPEFRPAQAEAVVNFVRAGGSAVFFLGPAAKAENYNERFAGLLPGRIGKAVGQVGPDAPAVRAVKNLRHPYLAGLYETPADYPDVLIQRYYRLSRSAGDYEAVLSTPAGEPIVCARGFGAGRVVLATTTADAEWNNLPTTALFLPMVTRICLAAAEMHSPTPGQRPGGDNTFPAGSAVQIRPRGELAGPSAVNVTMPDGAVEPLSLKPGPAGPSVTFTRTGQVGIYRWKVVSAGRTGRTDGLAGAFAVNPDGAESDLARADPAALAEAVKPAAVYFGRTLDEVHKAAADAAAGDNLWDRLLAVVIALLVVEAVVANRFRRAAEPAHAHPNVARAVARSSRP